MINNNSGTVDYSKSYNHLLSANLRLNGIKALFYACGLADCRYLEYAATLDFIKDIKPGDKVLDLGCGHSILPSIMASRTSLTCLDINLEALIWQNNRIENHSTHLVTVRAGGDNLPFNDNTFTGVVSISAIEHFKDGGDSRAIKEIVRVLKPGGICVLTVPLAPEAIQVADWTEGIPSFYQKILGDRLLLKILKIFNVDRDSSYFMQRYTFKSACRTFAEGSGLKPESFITFGGAPVTRFIHDNIIPQSLITILEYFSAKILRYSDSDKYTGGLILKLRKSD